MSIANSLPKSGWQVPIKPSQRVWSSRSQVQPSQEQPSVAADRQKIDPPKLKTADEKEEARKTKSSRRRSSSRRHHTEEDEQLALLEGPQAIETHQDASNVEPMVLAGDIPGPVVTGAVDIMAADDDEDSDDDDDDDLIGLDETLGDDFGDDDEDDDEDDEDDDDDDDEDLVALPKPKLQSAMAIMPLTEAVLPKPSYLVVDMRSELITRPLSEFADLGQIPTSEEKAKTLPVFDNHRVARRFSRNKQRVIKVPDGSLITRTSPYLTAKGITRLLVDGQVFDLASSD